MGHYQLFSEQKIPAPIDEVWDFISSPVNLKVITPDHMGFDITSTSKGLPDKMCPGMIISYKVSPMLGLKMTWVTEITQVKEKEFFVDEQRIGPYAMWHHQHRLIPLEDGVLMKDIVTYQPPMGLLGDLANTVFIDKKLKEIFGYRIRAMEEKFGKYPG